MNQTPTAGDGRPSRPVTLGAALPAEGDALITMATFAAAMEISESTAWQWSKADPEFPTLVRKGSKFTRVRLTDARRRTGAPACNSTRPQSGPSCARRARSPRRMAGAMASRSPLGLLAALSTLPEAERARRIALVEKALQAPRHPL